MSSPNEYPQLPPGVAPYIAGIASEFAAIRHGVDEAARHSPPVITLPAQDTNFVRPESQTSYPSGIAGGWANFGNGTQVAGYEILGTRVFLRGVLSPVAGALAANTFYTIFTLPVGVRPTSTAYEMFDVVCGDPISSGRVDVHPDGTLAFASQFPVPLNGYVNLSGITFSTL